MNLKVLSADAIPRALELAERYRLLNEPEQAASICHDVLAVDSENDAALRTLFLAITEQFHLRHGTRLEDADRVAAQIGGDYEHAYYSGLARERWARAQMEAGAHGSLVGDWLRQAMERYEQAERLRPAGNDDAILRWNACARLMTRYPALATEREDKDYLED